MMPAYDNTIIAKHRYGIPYQPLGLQSTSECQKQKIKTLSGAVLGLDRENPG